MFKRFVKRYLLGPIVYLFYRTLSFTWRVRIVESPELIELRKKNKNFIMAHWHGDELAILITTKIYRYATIVSQSDDGQIMNFVLKMLGSKTSRGSSSRGAIGALKGLIKLVKSGENCSFAVDGPKGPIYKVKPGVFEVSQMLNLPIFTLSVACDRAWQFPRSWNKTFLPKPFAFIYFEWGSAFPKIDKEMDPRSPELALQLEDRLHAAKKQALKVIAQNDA